jgi:hypothetical protein
VYLVRGLEPQPSSPTVMSRRIRKYFKPTGKRAIDVTTILRTVSSVKQIVGRAIAQAVSRWLLTAAARVRAQVRSCGIRGE